MITQLITDQRFVDENGKLTQRSLKWTQQVTNLSIITGAGTPESAVAAGITTLYMDTSGTAGSILYIKRDADVSGDRTQGWILV